jgi:cytochrome c oxidase subunit II
LRKTALCYVSNTRSEFWASAWRLRICVCVLISLMLAACEGMPSPLAPRGPGAARAADLWWLMLGIAVLIYIFVMGLLLWALFRRKQENSTPQTADNEGQGFILVNGVAMPAVVLAVLFILTLTTLSALAASARSTTLTIEVVGHQFWWEVNYPDHGVTTANEIHIPVGQPVQFKVKSNDVIHSFWVPELGGRMDMIPGRTNTTWLQADSPGEYRGQCTEFCGLQHANMHFLVIAQPADQFAAWLDAQKKPTPLPVEPLLLRGQQLFHGSACVYCHTIRGTNASSKLGPDLTHFASRRTLGAGVLPNNRGNLAGWIVDPQAIKPGNKMPPMYLSGDELQAMLAYLESLR